MQDAGYWIQRLQLQRHPEGGYFRETYRASESIAGGHLPARFGGDRAFSTAIYFLLEGTDFSAFHRIKQDELWHFYDGAPLRIHMIDGPGRYSTALLGNDGSRDTVPQAVVPAGTRFGAALAERGTYALVGCTVAPGFDCRDFEMPGRTRLSEAYPQHRALIESLTRG